MSMFILESWYYNPVVVMAPTILFCLIVLIGLIKGWLRGFRKSIILLIQMLIAFGIVAILFTYFFSQKDYDVKIVEYANKVLKGNTVQSLLGVSSDLNSIFDIVKAKIEILINQEDNSVSQLLTEISPYINVLVEFCLRLLFFSVGIIIFLLLKFIFFIIYLIFYSEHRYKRKKTNRFRAGIGGPYKKHRGFGLLVGSFRGVLAGVFAFSFLGSLLYVVSGGSEEKLNTENTEDSFGNGQYAQIYDAYGLIKNYGSTGIFKILGSIKDSNNVPYYFIFADSVYKGKLVDESYDINDDILLRDELASYTGLIERVLELAIKYDLEVVPENGQEFNTEQIVELFSNEEFIKELDDVIAVYETPKFITNLGIHLVDSFVTNIDNYGDLLGKDDNSQKLLGLLKVMFEGEDAIRPSDLLTAEDTRLLVKCIVRSVKYIDDFGVTSKTDNSAELKLANKYGNQLLEATNEQVVAVAAVDLLNEVHPILSELSMFKNEDRKDKINTTTGNCVDYCVKTYIKQETFDMSNLDFKGKNIDWTNELNNLGSTLVEASGLLKQINFKSSKLTKEFLNLFNEENEKYNENKTSIDKLSDKIASSELLGYVLEANGVYNTVDKALTDTLNTDIKIPRDIKWSNYTDEKGNNVDGDIKHLLSFTFDLVSAGALDLVSGTEESSNVGKVIDVLSNLSKKDNPEDQSTIEKFIQSDFVYYVLSEAISKYKSDSFSIYVPEDSTLDHEVDGTTYKLVKRDEITSTIDAVLSVSDDIIPEDGDLSEIDYKSLLTNTEVMKKVTSSHILEGTVVSLIYSSIESSTEFIYIPDYLKLDDNKTNMPNWLSTVDSENNKVNGELGKIIDAASAFDIDKILNSGSESFDISIISGLDDEKFDNVVTSDILYYSMCKIMNSDNLGTDIIVPNECVYTGDDVETPEDFNLVEKSELKSLFKATEYLLTSDGQVNLQGIIDNVGEVLKSNILHATAINYLLTSLEENEIISIPTKLSDDGTKDALKESFSSDNEWLKETNEKTELEFLVDSINILGIDVDNLDSFNISSISDFDENYEDTGKTKIELLCESKIIWRTISKKLDDISKEESSIIVLLDNVYDENEDYGKNIEVEELNRTITAIKTLGVDSIDNMNSIQISTLFNENYNNNVASLLNSKIVEASAAKKLSSTLKDNDSVCLPKDLDISVDSSYLNNWLSLRNTDGSIDASKYGEVKLILDSVKELGIGDKIDSGSMNVDADSIIFGNKELSVLYKSQVILYTISKNIFDKSDSIKVPTKVIEENSVDNTQKYIVSDEIDNMINAIKVFIKSLDDVNNIEISKIIAQKDSKNKEEIYNNQTLVLNSVILHATIIDKIIESSNGTDSLYIPNSLKDEIASTDNEKLISDYDNCTWIKEDEVKNIFMAVEELDLSFNESNNVSFEPDVILSDGLDMDVICSSMVIWSTVSHNILIQDSIIVPSTVKENDCEFENNNIKISEIKQLITSIKSLGLTSITSQPSISNLFSDYDTKVESILNSYILEATFVDKVKESMSTNEDIVIVSKLVYESIVKEDGFYEADDNFASWLSERRAGDVTDTGELRLLLDSINKLGIGNMIDDNSLDFSPNSILSYDDTKLRTIIKSKVMDYTLSKKISQIESIGDIPNVSYDPEKKDGENIALLDDETVNLILNAKTLVGEGNLESISSDCLLGLCSDDINTICENSMILHYILSNKIIENSTIKVTENIVGKLKNSVDDSEKAIDTLEISALIEAIKALNSGATSIDVSAINLDTLSDENIKTISSSTIIRTKVTESLSGLVMPSVTYDVDKIYFTTTDVNIVKDVELVNLVISMKSLGITDFNSELTGGNINKSVFDSEYENPSIILRATVSKTVLENFTANITAKDTTITDCSVLSSSELYQMLTDFEKLKIDFSEGGDSSSLAVIKGMDDKNRKDFINSLSTVCHIFISDLVSTPYSYTGGTDYERITLIDNSQKEIITKIGLITYFNSL